ncbi:MAG TPA: hypothetical protein VL294_11530 [Pseudolysinimonas sp.]|jgi:hypothetical protein|nr:hypothetical protein [Pseudolysinimonas sp.]
MERPDPRRGEEPGDIRRRLRAELIEDLPDSPDEPSHIALQLRVAMQTSVMQAHEHDRPLDADDAHVIAEFLSFAIDAPDSDLGVFGHRNGLDYDGARRELLELAARPTLRLEMREIVNWLATYLLYQAVPELQPEPAGDGRWRHSIAYKEELGLTAAFQVRGSPGRAELADVFDTITTFVLEHGVPALAYLRLPGVDAAAADLDVRFRERYVGSYRDLEAMFDTITEVREVDDDGKVGQPIRYRDQPPREQARLGEGAGSLWCAVDVGSQIHVFHRHR